MPNTFDLPSSLLKYKEYGLFCLKTRLTPRLKPLLGKMVDIFYLLEGSNPRINLSEDFFLSEDLEERVKNIINEEVKEVETNWLCLLLDPDEPTLFSSGISFGKSWFRTMLSYVVQTNFITFAELDEEGLIERRSKLVLPEDGKVYIDLRNVVEYKSLYSAHINTILTDLQDKFDKGYVINPPPKLIKRWKLKKVENRRNEDGETDQLYHMKEIPTLPGVLTPFSLFFENVVNGRDPNIEIHVGLNKVNYHYISLELFQGEKYVPYYFSGGSLFFKPSGLDDLIEKVAAVNEILWGPTFYGKVLTMEATRLSWMRVYAILAQRAIPGKQTVYVKTEARPMFVFSVMVPQDTNLDEIEYEMTIRGYRLLLYLKEKLNPPGGDIHRVLDANMRINLPSELLLPENFIPESVYKEHNILF